MKKNSVWGIISFIWLLCGLILLIFFEIGTYSEKYIFHTSLKFTDKAVLTITLLLIISFSGSFITAFIACLRKDTKKTLPIISVSVISSVAFLTALFVLTPELFSHSAAYGVITNYGIFDIPKVKLGDNDNRTLYEQRVLKNNTNKIPAVLGTRFGFNYVIAGEPDGQEILIESVIKYPPPGLVTGTKTRLADTSRFYVNLNRLTFFGYLFEHEYELIPGLWTIEFFYNGRQLFIQEFEVKKGDKFT